ncbi:hypothetical protein [Kribbella sp. NBC_00359]|uniref:hypothetical protein n=1 Tax=Kribbella sp. NBC_00359 TaxID=2975966 RepID=UPI002E236831
MSPPSGYLLLGNRDFDLDYRRIDAAASRNPGGPEAILRQRIVREMVDLASGNSNGHHPLGFESGKGDLRDCVTAYLQSDPQRPADFRLVFREIGAATPGELPRRELLAVRARYGVNSVYAHVCGRLGRRLGDRQPGLDRFGDRAPGDGGSEAARRAELEAKRAIAHAWAGQRPLASSRPLGQARPPSLSQASGARRPGRVVGTGWPERVN